MAKSGVTFKGNELLDQELANLTEEEKDVAMLETAMTMIKESGYTMPARTAAQLASLSVKIPIKGTAVEKVLEA